LYANAAGLALFLGRDAHELRTFVDPAACDDAASARLTHAAIGHATRVRQHAQKRWKRMPDGICSSVVNAGNLQQIALKHVWRPK
jgi:hypothetical protein